MIDIFINLLILIFIYLAVFTLYWCYIVFYARKQKTFTIEQKYYQPAFNNNLVVIIYAQNNEKDVSMLLEMLNKQDYSKQNYQVNIILDNCTDNSANVLEFIGGAKVWKVGDGENVGKDEAISWLLERLISFQNVNAFVFLNANRKIENNFLSSINKALFTNDVIIGSTELIYEDKSLKNQIIDAYNKFNNRIINMGRSLAGFSCVVDSDVVTIKQEVLEKIKCVDFKDINTELKYTTLLTKSGFKTGFIPYVKTYIDINFFKPRKPSITYRLNLFWHCLPLLLKSNTKFKELIFSTIAPDFWLIFVLYSGLLIFSYNYYFFFDFNVIFGFFILLVLSLIVALKTAKLEKKELLHLMLYPFYSLRKTFLHTPFIKKFSLRNEPDVKLFRGKKIITDAIVTDGKTDLACKLELISEQGLVRAIFKYKKKKYTSDPYIRMIDAIGSIAKKLEEHGFRLKLCQLCGYFSSKIDGSTNMVKGYCHKPPLEGNFESFKSSLEGNTEEDALEKFLWESCDFYVPHEINKIIDINDYKKGS